MRSKGTSWAGTCLVLKKCTNKFITNKTTNITNTSYITHSVSIGTITGQKG